MLMVDTVAFILVILFSLRNEKLPPGSPEIGLFRIRPEKPIESPEPSARRRAARL